MGAGLLTSNQRPLHTRNPGRQTLERAIVVDIFLSRSSVGVLLWLKMGEKSRNMLKNVRTPFILAKKTPIPPQNACFAPKCVPQVPQVSHCAVFGDHWPMHYGSAWVDRWSQVLLLGFWHVIHQNCRPFAGVLYLKELYKFVFSIWSKKQLKEIPLRALKGGKMPLNIFLQASKQLFWLKVHCYVQI